jgi:hypothetical protein
MENQTHARIVELIRRLDPTVVLKAAGLCDGHSIIDPQAFLDAGLPFDVVRHATTTHRSDGSPKGTLYVQGQPVESLDGVYGLDMLELLAGALGVKYPSCLGRGFQASAIREVLRRHLTSSDSN